MTSPVAIDVLPVVVGVVTAVTGSDEMHDSAVLEAAAQLESDGKSV
ncbi:MAG: hypothetical protein H0T42_27700 [Deltaproteobacteria bacterium]|nr:hypothetical protein [Deltaproteobacteria bacterium]